MYWPLLTPLLLALVSLFAGGQQDPVVSQPSPLSDSSKSVEQQSAAAALLLYPDPQFGGRRRPGNGNNRKAEPEAQPIMHVGTIPSSFFGLQVNQLSSYPLKVPYGAFRGWDSGQANWPDLEPCKATTGDPANSCFNWAHLDEELANVKKAGVNEVFYTLSRTPPWASPNSDEPGCSYYRLGPQYHGACHTPSDLNDDGSGENLIWKNWVTAIARHVNDPAYRQTHAHINAWEMWNEFNLQTSFRGSFNQLVRLAEDTRCIITGKGTIHNVPSAGKSVPCTAKAIDPDALIVSPSVTSPMAVFALGNFLYCDHKPRTTCTTGDAGAEAVDVIDVHIYTRNGTPEGVADRQLPKLRSILRPAELAKPVWNGEGSWGPPIQASLWGRDAYARAGYIPRYFAMLWSSGVTESFWYGYDFPVGGLYDRNSGQLRQPEAAAWTQTYNWLNGAIPAQEPFCQNADMVYWCDFTKDEGAIYRMVWDAKHDQTCAPATKPIICGEASYPVPAKFDKDWIDLNGATHPATGTVTIGANPIVLEGNAPRAARQKK